MIEKIKKHKGTFFMSCCLILVGLLSMKQYLLTGSIAYKRWASPEYSGLIITGWRALCITLIETATGVFGLLLIVKK
jgi:hypothetical protein